MKKIAFVVATLFCLVRTNAQIGLHIYKNDFTPSSIALGSSFSFNAIVRNDSSIVFGGAIGLAYKINNSAIVSITDSSSGLQFDTAGAILNQGDTVSKTIVVHVTGPQFLVGPSVVVIWPIANHAYALDSLVLTFNVLTPNGISTIDEDKVKAFVVNDWLMVTSENGIHLKRVRIYNVLGEEILNKQNLSNNIQLPEMNTGIYFAEITYNNNQRRVFRFYH